VSPLSVAEEAWTAEPVSYHGADAKRYTVAGSPGQPWTNPAMDLGEQRRPRVRSPWKLSLLTLATTALSCFLLAAIVHSYASRQVDTKGCNGVQMRPAFAKFTGFDTEHTRFASKYSLWLYREQYIDLDAIVMHTNMGWDAIADGLQVKGVPVLFITGNAGSFKQVRALAAEAATYFHEYVRHDPEALRLGVRSLDFFTADFNEDLTAFHGQTLLDQAEYLNDAVAYILSLYHDPERSNRDPGLPDPTSVIIIGHSMGGVVARTMLAMPNYQANSINTILTLSAPHARPPASFDAQIVKTYRNVNDYWRQAYSQKWANNNPLWHVTLISIAGGGLDTVVPSDYASISSLVPDTHGFTVFTSSIQDVWTGADHLAITWCDQLRKVIVKALLETTNVYRSSQTKPRADRMRIFKKWFLTGMEEMAERTLPHKEPETLLTLPDNSDSILAAGERLTIRNFGHSGKPTAHILPIPPMSVPGEKKFTLLSDQPLDASGASGKLEVLFCSVFPLQPGQSVAFFPVNIDLSGASAGTTRLACKNAASDVIHLPTSNRTSRYPFNGSRPLSYLQYKLEDLTEHQFVAVVDKGQGQSDGWAIAEFSDNADSRIKMDVGLRRLLATGLRLTLPAERPMVTEVKIPAIHSSLFAYKLRVGVQACGDETALFTPLLRQYVSEPYESKYFVNVKEADINVHGISPFMPPALGGTTVMDGVSLQLWSDPTCNTSVEVHLQADIPGSMGKLVMRYRTAFLAFPLLIVALVLRKQFMVHDVTGWFSSVPCGMVLISDKGCS
jgi:pimeloyl-ACP methyl ester carboxylesterase